MSASDAQFAPLTEPRQLRGSNLTYDPRLDRLIQFDSRSLNYPVRTILSDQAHRAPRSYTWRCNQWNDQGREGACVGFAWSHELSARPAEYKVGDATAQQIYRRAQELDPWPGEAYEGTSVLAGIQALQELYPGKIKQYRWAFSFDDWISTLGYHGPMVIGVNWYEGMYAPDEKGFIHPTGRWVGGHAILAYSVNVKEETIGLHNSWGRSWGKGGKCKISFETADRLRREEGEACVAVGRSVR